MEIESNAEVMESMESVQTMEDKPEAEPVVQEKAKKPLSEDRLKKLEKARARASEVAKEKRERKNQMPVESSGDPVVVVEQSESDEDQFEGPPGIIFVRRKRSKKAAPTPEAPSVNHEMNYLFASMFGPRKSTY